MIKPSNPIRKRRRAKHYRNRICCDIDQYCNKRLKNNFVAILPSYLSGESAIIVGRRSRTDHYRTRDD